MPLNTLTLNAYEKNGEQLFSRLEAQRILNIRNRQVLRRRLIAIGKDPSPSACLTWKNIEDLITLQLFLTAGHGKHSVSQFSEIHRQGLTKEMCRRFDLDPKSELEKIKNDYQQQCRNAFRSNLG